MCKHMEAQQSFCSNSWSCGIKTAKRYVMR